jgi:hypothetical protein
MLQTTEISQSGKCYYEKNDIVDLRHYVDAQLNNKFEEYMNKLETKNKQLQVELLQKRCEQFDKTQNNNNPGLCDGSRAGLFESVWYSVWSVVSSMSATLSNCLHTTDEEPDEKIVFKPVSQVFEKPKIFDFKPDGWHMKESQKNNTFLQGQNEGVIYAIGNAWTENLELAKQVSDRQSTPITKINVDPDGKWRNVEWQENKEHNGPQTAGFAGPRFQSEPVHSVVDYMTMNPYKQAADSKSIKINLDPDCKMVATVNGVPDNLMNVHFRDNTVPAKHDSKPFRAPYPTWHMSSPMYEVGKYTTGDLKLAQQMSNVTGQEIRQINPGPNPISQQQQHITSGFAGPQTTGFAGPHRVSSPWVSPEFLSKPPLPNSSNTYTTHKNGVPVRYVDTVKFPVSAKWATEYEPQKVDAGAILNEMILHKDHVKPPVEPKVFSELQAAAHKKMSDEYLASAPNSMNMFDIEIKMDNDWKQQIKAKKSEDLNQDRELYKRCLSDSSRGYGINPCQVLNENIPDKATFEYDLYLKAVAACTPTQADLDRINLMSSAKVVPESGSEKPTFIGYDRYLHTVGTVGPTQADFEKFNEKLNAKISAKVVPESPVNDYATNISDVNKEEEIRSIRTSVEKLSEASWVVTTLLPDAEYRNVFDNTCSEIEKSRKFAESLGVSHRDTADRAQKFDDAFAELEKDRGYQIGQITPPNKNESKQSE